MIERLYKPFDVMHDAYFKDKFHYCYLCLTTMEETCEFQFNSFSHLSRNMYNKKYLSFHLFLWH